MTTGPAPGPIRISAVVPLKDEAESLAQLHAELVRAFDAVGLGPGEGEVVFVDDGSRDDSWRVVCGLADADPRVRAIRFRRNFGKAAALTAGFRAARGAIVFTLDGDLQDDPAEIPRFLAKLDEGLDVVSGWKRTRHDPWHKVGPSRVFNALVSRMTGCRLHDHNCGFKAYRRAVVEEVRIYGELHRFVPVLAFARGFRVGEVVVQHRARRFGRSKYGVARFLKGFLDLLTVQFLARFGQRPLHVFGGLGLAMLGLGALGLIYLAALWVAGHRPIGDRPLLAYSSTLLGVGTQLVSLGILAELVTAFQIRSVDTFSVAETLNEPRSEKEPQIEHGSERPI
jgi:glycosyltransferase involved in cell wall biosynthesis